MAILRLIDGKIPPSQNLRCDCDCDNCCDVPLYSSYHCEDAKRLGLEYGRLQSSGFCHRTGYTPKRSWRQEYDWSRVSKADESYRARQAIRQLEEMITGARH